MGGNRRLSYRRRRGAGVDVVISRRTEPLDTPAQQRHFLAYADTVERAYGFDYTLGCSCGCVFVWTDPKGVMAQFDAHRADPDE